MERSEQIEHAVSSYRMENATTCFTMCRESTLAQLTSLIRTLVLPVLYLHISLWIPQFHWFPPNPNDMQVVD